MKEMLKNNMEDIVRKAKRKRILKRSLAMASIICLLCTALSLRFPANTLETIFNEEVGIQSVESVDLAEAEVDSTFADLDVPAEEGYVDLDATAESVEVTSTDIEAPAEEIGVIDLADLSGFDDAESAEEVNGLSFAEPEIAEDYSDPIYDLNGDSYALLSSILASAYPEISVADVESAGESVYSDDQALSVSVVDEDGDFAITALRDFIDDDMVELAFFTKDSGVYIVELKNGIEMEAVSETLEEGNLSDGGQFDLDRAQTDLDATTSDEDTAQIEVDASIWQPAVDDQNEVSVELVDVRVEEQVEQQTELQLLEDNDKDQVSALPNDDVMDGQDAGEEQPVDDKEQTVELPTKDEQDGEQDASYEQSVEDEEQGGDQDVADEQPAEDEVLTDSEQAAEQPSEDGEQAGEGASQTSDEDDEQSAEEEQSSDAEQQADEEEQSSDDNKDGQQADEVNSGEGEETGAEQGSEEVADDGTEEATDDGTEESADDTADSEENDDQSEGQIVERTVTIDVAGLDVPFSLNALMAREMEAELDDAIEEIGETELAGEEEAEDVEDQPEEIVLPVLTYDHDLLSIEVVEGDYLITPLASFEATTIIMAEVTAQCSPVRRTKK